MNISHSKVEFYNLCGYKYKLKYIDKLDVNKTFTPLLFGSACDNAFNYILSCKKKNREIKIGVAKYILNKHMNKWYGQNELCYYKNECPDDIDQYESSEDRQWAVFNNLKAIGEQMIDTYIAEILPLFKSIKDVQIRKHIKNLEEDTLILVVDFVAELQNGQVVTFDNKTTSDIKKNYPKHKAVKESQQLSIYTEYAENNLAGYIVLQKKPKDGKIVWDYMVDEVPEEQKQIAFERVDQALRNIKAENFEKNEKACFSYGKKCEYWDLCKKGNWEGIVKK